MPYFVDFWGNKKSHYLITSKIKELKQIFNIIPSLYNTHRYIDIYFNIYNKEYNTYLSMCYIVTESKIIFVTE